MEGRARQDTSELAGSKKRADQSGVPATAANLHIFPLGSSQQVACMWGAEMVSW